MLEIPERENRYWRWAIPLAWVLGASGLVVLVWWLFTLLIFTDQEANRPLVVSLERGPVIRTVAAYGKLLPRENTIIQAGVEGTVERVSEHPGAILEPDQPIVTLVNIELARRLDETRTALLEAQANAEAAQARMDRELLRASNEKKLAESDAKLATRKVEMLQVLLERNSISQLEFLQAEMEKNSAELRADLSAQSYEVTKRTVEAELRSSRLQIESAERAKQSAMDDLDRLTIRANRTGLLTVLSPDVKVGALIQRGQVIAQLAEPNSLYAELFVTASDAANLVPGQAVKVNVQGRSIPALLTRIDPSVADGQVRVIADITETSDLALRSNVDVSARITVAEVRDAIRVQRPARVATSATQLEAFVENGNVLEKTTLRVGVVGDEYIQVLEGLTPGQQIAITYPESWNSRDRIPMTEL